MCNSHYHIELLICNVSLTCSWYKEHNGQLVLSHRELENKYTQSQQQVADLTNQVDEAVKARLELNQELERSKTALCNRDNDCCSLTQRLEESSQLLKDREQELEHLQQHLQETEQVKCNAEYELEALRNDISDLMNKQNDLMNEVDQLRQEKEILSSQASLAMEDEPVQGAEKHNGDIIFEDIKGDQENKSSFPQYEKIVDEKEKVVQKLQDDVNFFRDQLSDVREELDCQRRKNNELREKNWKIVEALAESERYTDKKLQESQKEMEKIKKQAQLEAEKTVQETENKFQEKLVQIEKEVEERSLWRYQEEQKSQGSTDREKTIGEDTFIQLLQEQIDSCKNQINLLVEEVEEQKSKNSALQERNWKITEALREAEKYTKKVKKEGEQENKDKIKKLEEQIKCMKENATFLQQLEKQRICQSSEVKEKKTQEDKKLQIEDILKELEKWKSEALRLDEEGTIRLQEEQKRLKQVIQEVFPKLNVIVNSETDFDNWLQAFQEAASDTFADQDLFEKESLKKSSQDQLYLEASEHQNVTKMLEKELETTGTKLAETIEAKMALEKQASHYRSLLVQVEEFLARLQENAAKEEQSWTERLAAKDKEIEKKLNNSLTEEHLKTKKLLHRIFPTVNVNDQLDYANWCTQFEEALQVFEKLKPSEASSYEYFKEDERLIESSREDEKLAESSREDERLAESSREDERLAESSREDERLAESSREDERLAESSREDERLAEGSREDERLAEGSREDERLAEGSVEEEGLAEGSVEEEGLAEGSVGEEGLAEGSVGEEGLAEGSVGEEGLAEGSVEEEWVVEKFSESEILAEGFIKEQWLAVSSTEEQSLSEGSAKAQMLAEGSVEEQALAEGSVEEQASAEGSVEEQASAEGSVEVQASAEGSVEVQASAEGSVKEEWVVEKFSESEILAEGFIKEQRLAVSSIEEQRLSEGSVNEQMLAEGSVNEQMLAEGSVKEQVLVEGSVKEQVLVEGSDEDQGLAKNSVEEQNLAGSPLEEQRCSVSPVEEQRLAESSLEEQRLAESPLEEQRLAESPLEEQRCAESPLEEQRCAESPLEEQRCAESPLEEQRCAESPLDEQRCAESPLDEQRCAESFSEEQRLTEVFSNAQMLSDISKEVERLAQSLKAEKILSENLREEKRSIENLRQEERVAFMFKEEEIIAECLKKDEKLSEITVQLAETEDCCYKLETEVDHYKTIHTKDEELIKSLEEMKVKEADSWKEKLADKEQEIKKWLDSTVKEEQLRTKELLTSIFPTVTVEDQLDYASWCSQFKVEASQVLEQLNLTESTHSPEECLRKDERLAEMTAQLAEAGEYSRKLEIETDHYKTALKGTEAMLISLQKIAAREEENWKAVAANKELEHEEKMKSQVRENQQNVVELLKRLFPTINLDHKMDFCQWLSCFESEVLKMLDELQLKANSTDTELLKEQIVKLEEEKQTLASQVEQCNNSLHEKEESFKKLRTEVEIEEQTWREKFINQEKELKEEIAALVRQEQKKVMELLKEVFPSIIIDDETDFCQWLISFKTEMVKMLNCLQSRSSNEETELLQEQIVKSEEEKSMLIAQVEQYKNALLEAEDSFRRMKGEAETEEQAWREKFNTMEEELKEALKEKEELAGEKVTLETNLLQLQGIEEAFAEMQAKLVELQGKLQGEEKDKKMLEDKFEKVEPS
ncbi:kinectin-like [Limulus polyphemus]|uniref:Kinectin-like n=1 Tax=Limulus polyphemus TaxID=6850 RepID=A0ABM1T0G2_LIMPO|nr:kinectin-like [Limulus polyphemus]